MCDRRDCGFTALPGLIWKTSFPGSEPKNNYFLFFSVYDVNKSLCQKTAQPVPALGRWSLPLAPLSRRGSQASGLS